MTAAYVTLLEAHEAEIPKIKRSRFVGLAAPCGSESEAQAFLAEQRSRFHDARHHCWAWRVAGQSRSSDDGEPRNSAGAPILKEIEGRDLDYVVVVVVRWFGGVKLGTGGLVRAYGGAAGAVLDQAPTARVKWRTPLRVSYDYAAASAVQKVLHQMRIEPVQADYGGRVALTLHLAAEQVDATQTLLTDATGGSAELELLEPVAVPES